LVSVVTVALELTLNCLHREVTSFGSIFGRGKIFFFSPSTQTGCGAYSALGYWGLLPGDEMFGA